MAKRLPTMQETQIPSLGLEDPLEKETATHSSILAWKVPWTEEPGRLQSAGLQRVRHDWANSLSFFLPIPNNCDVLGPRSVCWAFEPPCLFIFYSHSFDPQGKVWSRNCLQKSQSQPERKWSLGQSWGKGRRDNSSYFTMAHN